MIDTEALRKKIIELAIQGKLTDQKPEDGNALAFIKKCNSNIDKEAIIKANKPFGIPSNWQWCRFSDIVDFRLGKTPPRENNSYWKNGLYPWVSIGDIGKHGIIDSTKELITQKAVKDCFSQGVSKAGTLIMSFKLSIGKVSILGIDAYHNEAIISIIPKYDEKNFVRDYLFYILPMVAANTKSHGAIKGNTLNKARQSII